MAHALSPTERVALSDVIDRILDDKTEHFSVDDAMEIINAIPCEGERTLKETCEKTQRKNDGGLFTAFSSAGMNISYEDNRPDDERIERKGGPQEYWGIGNYQVAHTAQKDIGAITIRPFLQEDPFKMSNRHIISYDRETMEPLEVQKLYLQENSDRFENLYLYNHYKSPDKEPTQHIEKRIQKFNDKLKLVRHALIGIFAINMAIIGVKTAQTIYNHPNSTAAPEPGSRP